MKQEKKIDLTSFLMWKQWTYVSWKTLWVLNISSQESWQKFKPTDIFIYGTSFGGVFGTKTDLVQTTKQLKLWTEILFILVIYEKYWNTEI